LGLGTGTGKRNSNGGSLSALLHSPASQGSALGSAGEDNIPVAVAAQAKSATSPLSPSTSPALSSPGLSSPALSGDVGLDEWVFAAFPFKGTDEDDLSFKAGDRIRVVEKNDPGWWKGELNGKQGLMPVTYLRLA
jgi:hypothetical protein